MKPAVNSTLEQTYPHCRRILGSTAWEGVRMALGEDTAAEIFADRLEDVKQALTLPGYIDDLARIEWALQQLESCPVDRLLAADTLVVNPQLTLVPVRWSDLAAIVSDRPPQAACPTPIQSSHMLVWRNPVTGSLQVAYASDDALLALKIVMEEIDPRQAAASGGVQVSAIDAILGQAVRQGLLISPESRIRRTYSSSNQTEPFFSADTFTLQWHITQACDLHCKHCYDRSDRKPMPLDMAMDTLYQLYRFCREMNVKGHVTFTGGNPLLYPHIQPVYQAAANLGFSLAILGNPGPIDPIERLAAIARPAYFQISLEGLAVHNDYIRGPGHFERSLAFLDQLRGLGIYTMVMLTLTRDNIDQVLPLAEQLQDRVDAFNFNRLSAVGEGARLMMPDKQLFEDFLRTYDRAAATMPMLGLKDNLINIIKEEKQHALFGGCTGYGCGAAFNFVALLPDGQVHACRKFPSLLGNLYQSDLATIYHSDLARRYRTGSRACRDCSLAAACRGCLAVVHNCGKDIFEDKDPFCFKKPFRPA